MFFDLYVFSQPTNRAVIIRNRNQICRKLTGVGAVCAKENGGLVRQLDYIVSTI